MTSRQQVETRETHFHRGRIYGAKGMYEQAVREYQQALALDPNYAPARRNLKLTAYLNGKGELIRGLRRKG